MEDEEDFPRGGQSVLTALERREIRQQAMNDTLFREVRVNTCTYV